MENCQQDEKEVMAPISNGLNLFDVCDANQLSNLVCSLMPETDKHNRVFRQNASLVATGLIQALVEKRDKKNEKFSAIELRDCLFDIERICTLAKEQVGFSTLQMALQTLGWEKDKVTDHQPKSFKEQFTYARAYLVNPILLVGMLGQRTN